MSLAATKIGLGSCQSLVWQPPKSCLAAVTLGFGSCQTQASQQQKDQSYKKQYIYIYICI